MYLYPLIESSIFPCTETSLLPDRRKEFVVFNGLCVKAVCRILTEYRVPCAMCSALGWLFIYILHFFFLEFHHCIFELNQSHAIGLIIECEVPIG